MNLPLKTRNEDAENEFERAGQEDDLSLFQEFTIFLKENRKWWLIPIFVSLALIAMLVALSATGAAPFIYTLF